MIFQEPMTSLNPVFRAGEQVDEVVKLHNPEMTDEEVKQVTLKMIDMVGIANGEGVYEMYSPRAFRRYAPAYHDRYGPWPAIRELIIADEPTTALGCDHSGTDP